MKSSFYLLFLQRILHGYFDFNLPSFFNFSIISLNLSSCTSPWSSTLPCFIILFISSVFLASLLSVISFNFLIFSISSSFFWILFSNSVETLFLILFSASFLVLSISLSLDSSWDLNFFSDSFLIISSCCFFCFLFVVCFFVLLLVCCFVYYVF